MLEFYKDRIKKQSVKNFMLHNSRGQFIMQFGRSKEDNVFALDFTGPFSPLAAFGVALVSAIILCEAPAVGYTHEIYVYTTTGAWPSLCTSVSRFH